MGKEKITWEMVKNGFGLEIRKLRIFWEFFLGFLAIWQFLGGTKYSKIVVIIGGAIELVLTVVVTVCGMKKLKKVDFSTDICGKSVILCKDSYQMNMCRLLTEKPNDINNTVFITGMDRSGNLNEITPDGIIRGVCTFLDDYFICGKDKPSDVIQNKLDKIKENRNVLDNARILDMGECIKVELELQSNGKKLPNKRTVNGSFICRLLLVANAARIDSKDSTNTENITDDGLSYMIIPKAMAYIDENNIRNVMVGVMGTRSLHQPYQVVFSQIINQFARIVIKNNNVDTLYISFQEEDYNRWRVSLVQLESYLQLCNRFYKKEA